MVDGGPDTAHANRGEDDDEPSWVSVRAVAWVLDHAPCPAPLVSTLIAIARHADDGGRGARPSAATVAQKVGKRRRQVERDIAALVKLGLLVRGDQSGVQHLPEGQRPVVYDLPLWITGDKPVAASRGGKRTTVAHDGGRSVVHDGSTHDAGDGGTTVAHDGQKNPVNNPVKKPAEEDLRSLASLGSGHVSAKSINDEQGRRSDPLINTEPLTEQKPRTRLVGKRSSDDKHCGHPGCVWGSILVPADDPKDSRLEHCPGCWVGYVDPVSADDEPDRRAVRIGPEPPARAAAVR